jgi:TonB-linked SusC/RagA family outer membrane protein
MKKQHKTNSNVKNHTIPFFIFLFVAIFSPVRSFTQNTVTLNLKNVSLVEFFNEIEKNNGIRFSYVDHQLDSKKDISIQTTNEPIDQVLNKVLLPKGYEYTRTGSTYAVTKKITKPAVIRKYNGLVTDDKGTPVIGATVKVDGTNIGTITDVDGKFSLEVSAESVLHVSYIGYETSKIVLSSNTNLNIRLKEDTKLLDEVVVVGYGTIRKSDLTGAVSSLRDENSDEKPFSTVEQMIQGRVAGVQITQNTGALGGGMTFSIRGANSMSGSNQPLVVIDGYPVESGEVSVTLGAESTFPGGVPGSNALSMLNPNDIESIEILKDASSTAIYGSRGANGVVLVTTKSGKEGRDKVEYSFRTDLSYLPKKIEVLSTPEYLAYSNEAYMDRANGSTAYTLQDMNESLNVNTNWQDLIYQTGLAQNHQLNLSGGDKKMRYALSAGYLTQRGIVKNTNFDRGTFKLNLDREVNVRFKFGFNLHGNLSTNQSVQQASRSNDLSASVVNAALRTPPIYKDYEEDEIAQSVGITNPLILITRTADIMKMTYVRVAGFADYKLNSYITFRARAGINRNFNERQFYMPRGTYLGDQRLGYAYNGNMKRLDYLSEFTLSYNKTIQKKHRINAVGGYTWQNWISVSDGISAAGFPNDKFIYYEMGSASSVDKPVTRTQEWSLASVLGRINYTYDGRYLFTLTGRYDGSSRLARGYKWNLFPSAAFGWNMHNERFMKNQNIFSEVKWRASYGLSGNQSVGVGSTLSKYGTATGVINQQSVTVYYPLNMENPTLKWETTAQTNVGVDVALLKNRIKFNVDAYRKHTYDLLIDLPVPLSTGYSIYTSNIGEVENKGIELGLEAHVLSGADFNWKINGNISFNRNKILKLDGEMTSFSGPTFATVAGQPLHIAKVGYPIGAFYGYRINGIYQTQEEVDNGPVDPANPTPGSFKFVDISGPDGVPDGLISDYDREVIGNPYPDYVFGITNDFSWKSFSLNVFIQGSIGQDVINANRYQLDGLSRTALSNVSREAYQNRWTGPGTSNKYPAASSSLIAFQGRFADFIVEDASYVRLKSVTLSYNIPTKSIKRIQNCKVFVTGSNLITITNYSGYDPEVNSRGENSMTPGVDGGSIPQFRTFSAGFNIGF